MKYSSVMWCDRYSITFQQTWILRTLLNSCKLFEIVLDLLFYLFSVSVCVKEVFFCCRQCPQLICCHKVAGELQIFLWIVYISIQYILKITLLNLKYFLCVPILGAKFRNTHPFSYKLPCLWESVYGIYLQYWVQVL